MSDIDSSHARDPMTQLPEPVRQAVEGAHDKKALDIVVLDLRGSAAFTDFFVVCSGQHPRQVKAIVDGIEARLRLLRTKPAHVEGYDRAEWVLMDFFDFVVHVFTSQHADLLRLGAPVGQRGADRDGPPRAGVARRRRLRTAGTCAGLIARSQSMRRVIQEVRRFSGIDANVLISGETGVGKGAVARALHAVGPRRSHPFVIVDCLALPINLIEAEIFGFERGAFSGAVDAKAGKFELAGRGTVYLDGVSELALEVQGKLLRAVEDKHVDRIGGLVPITLRARIVASTIADIEDAVRDGLFREDLYHRLRVLPLRIPSLRDRRPDILPLARAGLRATCERLGRPSITPTKAAATALEAYPWPGNVRELFHVIERAVLSLDPPDRTRLDVGDLPLDVLDDPYAYFSTGGKQRSTLADVERRYIELTLRSVRGSQTRAAHILGISRKSLWEKRKKYRIT